jgi:hypothetical protein
MIVLKLMELAVPGWKETGTAIEWMKEAIEEMRLNDSIEVHTEKIDIVKNQRYYPLPQELVALKRVLYKVPEGTNKGSYAPLPKIVNKGDLNEYIT